MLKKLQLRWFKVRFYKVQSKIAVIFENFFLINRDLSIQILCTTPLFRRNKILLTQYLFSIVVLAIIQAKGAFIYSHFKRLERIKPAYQEDQLDRHDRKLFNLYGGQLFRKQEKEPVMNLSIVEIPNVIKKILSLGMNGHLLKLKLTTEKLRSKLKNYIAQSKVMKLIRRLQ